MSTDLMLPHAHTRLITTPHPVTCEGQRNFAAPLIKGETLGQFLRRSVPNWTGDAWEVRINGVVVPLEVMDRVRPKDGTLIEVRSLVKKQALYIVAMIALTYFTMGAGAGWIAGAAGVAAGGTAAMMIGVGLFMAGSILINKVLGPKPASAGGQADQNTVYNIGAGRNQARPYQPLPLVFGVVKYAPDIISAPYTWYEGEDQILGMVLTPGINAQRVEALTNGDAPLSAYEGVQVYHAGFPGMPDQQIPLYSDADTIQGGELNKDQTWVQRATPARTVRIQVNLEYILGDQTSKGKPYLNVETVEVQYRVTGATNWMPLVSRNFANSSYDPKRATLARDVAEGQYDVRVRILGRAIDGGGSNGRSQWQWTTMTAVQADTASYAGIPRIGVRIKATGQLNGAPDELRCVVHSRPIPVWKGTSWVTEETSNPGAQILQYARGISDENGDRIAGIGLSDDMIDIAALQAFMLHCAAHQFGYNYVVKDARNHDEMVNSLAAAGFGQVTWAGGRLSVVWAAADQPLSGVVNMATIKKGQFQVDYTLANAADGIEFTYYDAEDWSTKTIRVPAPGVTTMLNPATVTGEGVTSEAHAAMLARWHLAQSLYQYKDISFATDIEHLSYQRLSLLSLSHDLTQWGFSGRLVGASIVGGVVSLALDEPVPSPPPGGAYVGLRIPGERTYRVFGVQPFEGTSSTLTLTGAWPNDAPLPGDAAGNPAHDTLWCYDFKATPGYRVRVVAIEPESDLKGARVAVVPESAEFWHYVTTGEYIPAPNESLLQTRPVASGLKVSERQVVQGDTVFTELVASFEIDGPVGDVIVQMSDDNDELVEVARTTTRTAAWRIPGAGTYQIVVRPFAPDGRPGVATVTIYTTIGADAPPVLVDLFDVEERSGGVRLYTWGWLAGTTQSADFAGVEIRYTAGSVPAPDWEAMTPVGADGYHTAPFEAVIPDSGQWTFAARSRNTSGTLSTGMRVVTKTLTANLGEQLDDVTQRQQENKERLDQEIIDRFNTDAAVAANAAADATAKANAARDTALAAAAAAHAAAAAAQADAEALAAQLAEITGADEWSPTTLYAAAALSKRNGALYRALRASTNKPPESSPLDWEKIGDYASLGEAVAAALSLSQQTATDLAVQATRLDAVTARMPTGTGPLAASATVSDNNTASINRDTALGARLAVTEARMPTGSGELATLARVVQAETTAAAANSALATRTTSMEARMPTGTGPLATQATVTAYDAASVTRDTALGNRTTAIETRLPTGTGPLASEARVVLAEQAAATAASANASRISVVEGRMPTGTDKLANEARVVQAETAAASANAANASAIQNLQAGLRNAATVTNGGFEFDGDWSLSSEYSYYSSQAEARNGSRYVRKSGVAGEGITTFKDGVNTSFAVEGGASLRFGGYVRALNSVTAAGYGYIAVAYDASGSIVGSRFAQRPGGASHLWALLEDVWALPATAVSCHIRIRTVGHSSGVIGFDDAYARRVDPATTANANAITATDVRVAEHAGQLLAQAQLIQGLQATSGSQSASINTLMQVNASSSAAPDVRNASFETVGGWGTSGTNEVLPAAASYDATPGRTGARRMVFTGNADIVNTGRTGVRFGERLRMTAWGVRTGPSLPAAAQVRIIAREYDAAGGFLSTVLVATAEIGAGFAYIAATALYSPSSPNVSFVTVQLSPRGVTSGAMAMDDVSVERLTTADESAMAKFGIYTDVNGNIAGIESENNGQVSTVSILATVFRVFAGAAASGMEWQASYIRIYGNGYQLVMGTGFGTGSNLVQWFGPNIGAANCTTANCTECKTITGQTFIRGSNAQGHMEITNTLLQVFDVNNVRRIRLGLP
ncbi:carbohydrate-binding protein [Luteimonas sp. XNQY3]|nr:host specificity factor TipJ family phage tail protein [Luteimonas sp. XNQY3]MCD9005240.1 carbohydrate-binding protein [Luteimonas sp. XNQY3]